MSGGGGSSGGGTTTTVQKADPWSGVAPYLSGLYQTAVNQFYNQNGPQVYSGQQIANPSIYTNVANDRANVRSYGSSLEQNAAQQANNIVSGNDQAIAQYTNTMNGGGLANALYANNINGVGDAANLYKSTINGGGLPNALYSNIINNNDQLQQSLMQAATGTDAQGGYYRSVLNGDYLNAGNPYLSAAVNAASADTTRNFQNAVAPSIASQFSAAGRYGSGAQNTAFSDANNNLAGQLSNTAAGIYNQNYQNERNLQQAAAQGLGQTTIQANQLAQQNRFNAGNAMQQGQLNAGNALMASQQAGAQGLASNIQNAAQGLNQRQAMGFGYAPTANQIDWTNINNQANVGANIDTLQQAILNGNINTFNQKANSTYNNINWLNSILTGGANLGGIQTGSQTVPGQRTSFGGALGMGASGALLGTSIMPGIGTAIGGIGGLLAGLL